MNTEETKLSEKRKEAIERLKNGGEEELWEVLVLFQNHPFYTVSGLEFRYSMKRGKNGEYTREIVIDRKNKEITRSSILLAYRRGIEMEVVPGPKSLGQIFGVSYLYSMFWQFGIITVPDKAAEKMKQN